MCNCKSDYLQTGMAENVSLISPFTGEKLSIDACLEPVIKKLWQNGVVTLNSCCGHNQKDPSFVVPEVYTEKEIENIKSIIKSVDNRKFKLFQWKITEV